MSAVLLATKLYIPPAPLKRVPRPRLLARFAEGLARPLTLLSAPAGFGKTTLISEWRESAEGRAMPLAWLSLDEDDNDPLRFLTYMAAALSKAQPGLGDSMLALVAAPQPPPAPALLPILINDLSRQAAPCALVLDDYHLITAPPVHEALRFLLEHLPPSLRLVISTRSDPPLPLARLRARHQMVELRAADLRFTRREAAAFLTEVMDLPLGEPEIAALEARTEGWAAGLQLAALSLQGQSPSAFVSSFAGSHRYVVDYLADEVLSRQPEPVRTFLLQTSILEQLSAELCDAVTGRTDSQSLLEGLERGNLFLIPIDDERRWYRYHRLFADVLRSRLALGGAQPLYELHRRASEWYERHGLVSQALAHALLAQDPERAAQLVERNGLSLLMRGELATVLNWIQALGTLAHERPWLCIFESWALTLTGQLDGVDAWLRQAEEHIPANGASSETKSMRGHLAALRAYGAAQYGQAERAVELGEAALELLPPSDLVIRSVVMMTLGTAHRLTGDLGGAARSLVEARRAGLASGNLYLAIGALSALADLYFAQGRLHQSADAYRELWQSALGPEGRPQPAAGMACFGLGLIYYEWNDLARALDQALRAVELCRLWGNIGILAASHGLLFRIRQAQGERQAAEGALDEAERLVRAQPDAPRAPGWVEALRVRQWLAAGNRAAAERWARERAPDPGAPISFLSEDEFLALARVLMVRSEHETALAMLERLARSAETDGRSGSLIEILVLQSLTLQPKGDGTGALAALAQALALARPEGYVRVFLDEGAPMADLLRRAGSHGLAPEYVSELLAAFARDAGAPPGRPQPLIEPLSERELEVLRLLAEGLANAEIARRLVVTLGTVKTHTSNIYRKLEVENRSQAVARAQALKLI